MKWVRPTSSVHDTALCDAAQNNFLREINIQAVTLFFTRNTTKIFWSVMKYVWRSVGAIPNESLKQLARGCFTKWIVWVGYCTHGRKCDRSLSLAIWSFLLSSAVACLSWRCNLISWLNILISIHRCCLTCHQSIKWKGVNDLSW